MSTLIGDHILFARQREGWTAKGVAQAAGISAQYLCDIELGRRVPPPETLERLCSVLKLGQDYAFYRAGYWPKMPNCLLMESEFNAAWDTFCRFANELIAPATAPATTSAAADPENGPA